MTQQSHGRRRLDTGSLVLNRITAGGIPTGTLFEIRGADTADKDYVVARIGAAAQQQGYQLAWVDTYEGMYRSWKAPGPTTKFDLAALGLDPNRMTVLYTPDGDLDQLASCAVRVQQEPTVVVVDDLASYMLWNDCRLGDQERAQDEIRHALNYVLMSGQGTGSILIVLNDQKSSQFSYAPSKSLRATDAACVTIPPNALSGICQMQALHLERKKSGDATGAFYRLDMLRNLGAKPHLTDQIYVNYRYGLTDLATIVRIARDQAVLSFDEVSKIYSASSIIGFMPRQGPLALHDYLRTNDRVHRALINAIDWTQTPYEPPRV